MEINGVFESGMKGRWDQVVNAYEKNPSLQFARITKSQDTPLHIAVSNGRTEVVMKLLEIFGDNASIILHMKNERGNTPLHLAAALGNAKLCHLLAAKDLSLVCTRNSESETPLFLSAFHGKEKAFLCLHYLYKEVHKEIDCSMFRKSNGDTILHSAISGEYFRLAFQIIRDYPELVDSVNEKGQTPLHILASKPNAFRSGCHLPPISRLFYPWITVHELQLETHNPEAYLNDSENEASSKYPQNYEICMSFFCGFRSFFQVLTRTQKTSIVHQVRQFFHRVKSKDENAKLNDEENAQKNSNLSYERHYFPPNYETPGQLLKIIANFLLIVLGFGISKIRRVREKKERHVWATQIMNELVQRASLYNYGDSTGQDPRNSSLKVDRDPPEFPAVLHSSSIETHIGPNSSSANQNKKDSHQREKNDKPVLLAAKLGVTEMVDKFLDAYPAAVQELNTSKKSLVLLTFDKKETKKYKEKGTPLLLAAKMGITEIVDRILDTCPAAILELDYSKKNVVLLAVEHRQTDVYNLLLNKAMLKESVFRQLDKHGNSALHLAAKHGDYRPRLIPGAALQMQWEIKWYKFVKNSMKAYSFVKHNNKGQTPKEIFTETHKDLVVKGSEWLTKTSESCSVVAALIATVAFATSASIPGGFNDKGTAILLDHPAFEVFAIAALVALCFSVTALMLFLSILTSRFHEHDFAMDLPRKLFFGLTSLFTSVVSILLSFCAGHFFVLKQSLRFAAYPLYAATCLPVSFFAVAQLPLYFDLMRAILREQPQDSYKQKVSLSDSKNSTRDFS